ncbi:DUF4082 domain-containing protein [Nostoc sp. FACHB-110]|uniref:DUF4082 domain-containing protein n=1 Tax=Nostoc sp. FACHB-110 TaxID=2692834 RepID=UPI001686AF18|nr:DUF4082 domain-containing protein [Nostoc sp. FACHB-110]MBD2436257.1 DUF4082 domain-containing protein [Nostoc sp. FACHB-110]
MPYIKGQHLTHLKHLSSTVLLTGLATVSFSLLPISAQTVTENHSLWCTSAKPMSNVPDSETRPVEVGVKFTTRESGKIVAVRFYRQVPIPSGYQAHVWSEDGRLLGSGVAIEGQGPTPGWQTVQIYPPVSVVAGETYIASYFASTGQYSADLDFKGIDNGPLSALSPTVDNPNGVYVYTQSGGVFPNNSYNNTNYWVDVILQTVVAQ